MNRNLENAILDIAKVDAVMFAIEAAFINGRVGYGGGELANRAENAFYALWDAIRRVSEDLDLLAGDQTVVDAIFAVNDVRRNCTLKTED